MGKLSEQLLVRVLQHVQPAQRLGSCALVCRAWRAAAAMATTEIDKAYVTQATCDSLSAWLQSHPAPAAISSISINAPWSSNPQLQLQLPLQQLRGLHVLILERVPWMPAAQLQQAAGPAGAAAGLQALPALQLTAVTHLELDGVSVQLDGVASMTALQKLK